MVEEAFFQAQQRKQDIELGESLGTHGPDILSYVPKNKRDPVSDNVNTSPSKNGTCGCPMTMHCGTHKKMSRSENLNS